MHTQELVAAFEGTRSFKKFAPEGLHNQKTAEDRTPHECLYIFSADGYLPKGLDEMTIMLSLYCLIKWDKDVQSYNYGNA